MNNITFVMGIVLTMLILFLSLGAQGARAADMDDVTLQVLESNDPADIVNDISLPDVDDSRDAMHDNSHDMEDDVHNAQDEIKDDIDDSRDDIEDSIDEAEVEGDNPTSEGD